MMSLIRRYAMLGVKEMVGLIPKNLKNVLKSNPKLTSFYSRSLQKSGLFYGFPSPKKMQANYETNMGIQNAYLENLGLGPVDDINVVIVINRFNRDALSTTLDSVIHQHTQIRTALLMCTESDLDDLVSFISDLSELPFVIESCTDLRNSTINMSLFFLNQGDVLHIKCISALKCVMKSDVLMGYVDTDSINEKGERHAAEFYPDWNRELQLSTVYIRSGLWVRTLPLDVLKQTYLLKSSLDIGFLCILMYHQYPEGKIFHLPLVLVHKTYRADKITINFLAKLQQLYAETQLILRKDDDVIEIRWPILVKPLVSLIIPTKNAKHLVEACIESIFSQTEYQNYEILLIDNNSDEPESIEYFRQLAKYDKVKLLSYKHEFNYSAINNFAVRHAQGEIIGLINNDIVAVDPLWLTRMLGQVLRSDVGCVGAKLMYADGRIQHAGVVLGYGGGAGHAHKYFPQFHSGYLKRLVATQNYSAVTAACLLVKKCDYDLVNGLDENNLVIAFNDVDFCLKLAEVGKRNVYVAEATMFHLESVSRGLEDTAEKQQRFANELAYIQQKWAKYIENDPAYNPNLTLKRENFSIKLKSEYEKLQTRVG
jgi:GT2 family glycosyltransferase